MYRHHVPEMIELQRELDRHLGLRRGLRVLDLGSGELLRVRLGRDPYVVGVDASRAQLDRNPYLSEAVLADLGTYEPQRSAWDVAICWNTLEHLDDPGRVIDRLLGAVRPGGLALFAVPNPRSLKGLVTRATPFRFHLWYYRRLKRQPNRTRGPFRTFFRPAARPESVLRSARAAGFRVVFARYFESPMQVRARRQVFLRGRAWTALDGLASVISAGALRLSRTDFVCVLQRPA